MMYRLGFLSLLFTALLMLGCDEEESGGNAPAGAVCSGGGDCVSGTCALVGGQQICVSPCYANGTCDAGFQCDTTSPGGEPLCLPTASGIAGSGTPGADSDGTMTSATPGTAPSTPAPATGVGGSTDAVAACNALYNCSAACQSNPNPQSCQLQCENMAPTEAVRLFRDFNNCLVNNCVTAAGSVDQSCIFTTCAEEAASCGFGGGASGATPSNVEFCGDINGCARTCGDDQVCAQGCLTQLDADSQALYSALGMCVNANCSASLNDPAASSACLIQNCQDEFLGCEYDGLTYGSGSCSDTYACYWDCRIVDTECQRNCRGLSNETSNALFSDFFLCTQTANCAMPGLSCWEAECAAEKAACDNDAGGPPTMTGGVEASAGAEAAAGAEATAGTDANAGAEESAGTDIPAANGGSSSMAAGTTGGNTGDGSAGGSSPDSSGGSSAETEATDTSAGAQAAPASSGGGTDATAGTEADASGGAGGE